MELGGPADLSVSAARLGEVGGCLEDRFKGCRRACSSLSASIMWWFFFDLILLNITLDPVQFFNGCCVLFFWFVQFWLRSWAACWICSICVRRCPHFQPLYKKKIVFFFILSLRMQFNFYFFSCWCVLGWRWLRRGIRRWHVWVWQRIWLSGWNAFVYRDADPQGRQEWRPDMVHTLPLCYLLLLSSIASLMTRLAYC